MDSVENIINTLKKIQQANSAERTSLIFAFQKVTLNAEGNIDEDLEKILCDLAIDLDYYEPNADVLKTETNLYGESRLTEILDVAIAQLKKYSKADQR